ncbi:MAG: exopolysaccharide biosynthesis polyprenyl glycosylphosphotransferase [Opitutaceae bacterium]
MSQHAAIRRSEFAPPDAKTLSRHATTRVLVTELVGDTLVILLTLALSSWLRFETSLVHFGTNAGAIRWTDYLGQVLFGTVLFVLLLPHRELYDLHRIFKFRQVAFAIMKAAVTWLVAYMALSWLLRGEGEISRLFVTIAFFVTTTSFIAWRFLLFKFVSEEPVAQRLRQRILFVGWSDHARVLARAILRDGQHPYQIAGYVPSWHGRNRDEGSVFVRKVGEAGDMLEVLRRHEIDVVMLTDGDATTNETMALANLCEKEMIEFKVVPSCSQILLSCLRLQTVSGVPVLGVSYFPLDYPFNVLLKQLVDIVGGIAGTILSAPIIGWYAFLVYRESPGPVIYRQLRLGQHGRPFWIYKIRSMRLDAEGDGCVGWSRPGDPRRLQIGAFMRRWNIDELPQFWNVLKGDMSLVGPRPERPELIDRFKEEISHYNARHNIKPGITGWAQVNGFRGDTDLNERIRCDLFYIENWSPLLDLQIMVMTLFRHKNAA